MNMNFQMENMSVPRNSSEPVQMDWGRAMSMMSHMMNMTSSDMSWLGQVNWLPNVDPRYIEAIQNSINSLVATVNQANMDRYVGGKTWLLWLWRHQMKHFPRYCPFVREIHRSLVDSPHKWTLTRTFEVSLLSVWPNCWTNTRLTGNSRRHDGHLTSP